jgi:hypothetical protein
MTTGYTHSQIQEFIDAAANNAPPHPTSADLRTAPVIARVATAGTELGALLRLALKDRKKQVTFFLNPYIALELMLGINEAAVRFNWWERLEGSKTKPLPDLVREDLKKAIHVVSIATSSEPNGLLIRFAGLEPFTFYMPRKFSADMVALLRNIGDIATWWDQNFVLLPKPH